MKSSGILSMARCHRVRFQDACATAHNFEASSSSRPGPRKASLLGCLGPSSSCSEQGPLMLPTWQPAPRVVSSRLPRLNAAPSIP
eukprot:2779963-Amphidinium_carterae.1